MGKELSFRMSKQIAEMSMKPLRTREEAILLLLYTIRMLDISKYLTEERSEKIKISISKMNRIFYLLEYKMFSMQFPFCVEDSSEQNDVVIYHHITGTIISPRIVSFLIEAFEKMNRKEMDFEMIFEIIMENEIFNDEFTSKEKWLLISHLLKYDLGYIRYDFDPKQENGRMHPLNHLDISFDTSTAYKIGLSKRIEFNDLKNILDITTECWYIG